MKSSIEETSEKSKKSNFPVLKKWKSECDDLIVLFYGENDGICIHSGSSIREIGERGPWVSAFSLEWEDFKGKVILEN